MSDRKKRLATLAWGVVIYNVAVILWGAWVRISFSGDGCGSHWPTCGGEFIPTAPTTKKLIEYAHRATSGISVMLVIVLAMYAFRATERGHPARRGAIGTAAFLFAEAALGAGLVLLGLVGNNDSALRAIVVALHLVNTLSLTGFGVLTAWWASGGTFGSAPHPARRWLYLALTVFVLTGLTGAITALGDTLFPVKPTDSASLFAAVRDELSFGEHFLVRLRVIHPIIAALVAFGFALLAITYKSRAVLTIVVLQVATGAATIWLSAPAWIQLVHLALAQALWVALVLLTANTLRRRLPQDQGDGAHGVVGSS